MQTAIVLLLVLVLALSLSKKMNSKREAGEYSTKRVSVTEVQAELGFGIYGSEDWNTYFSSYHNTYLTVDMLGPLLVRLGVEAYIKAPEDSGRREVSRKEWNDIYEQVLDYLDMADEVSIDSFLVLDSMEAAEENVIVTNKGDYYTSLPLSYFKNWNAYQVYSIGEQCLGISGISEEEECITNAYLKTFTDDSLTFLYGGAEYVKEVGKLETELFSGVCDLVFKETMLKVVRSKQDVIKGQLLSYDETSIEIEGYGKISHEGKLPVYQTYGEVAEKAISDVILGNMELEYVTGDQQVCAILIREPASIADIRVLLLAEDGGNYRSDVYLKCSSAAAVSCGETQETKEPDTLLHVSEYLAGQAEKTFVCSPDTAEGQIFICDASGNPVSNGYYGKMEVRFYDSGYTLVNQLPFETYLYAVVPSEMPSTFEPEAQKAQAVCARSYAYQQLMRSDLAQYGAHINDSTSYQVYNKTPQTENAVSAVNSTAGEVLTYQGNIIEAYYFSTSMGYTGTADIWNIENQEAYGYLKSVCLNTEAYGGDLSDETGFLEYIKNKQEGYDSGIKYYRWFATADYTGKTNEINNILQTRRQISGANVLLYGADGKTEQDSTEGFGNLTGISVQERSSFGAVLTLKIQYEHGMALVKNEYNIRQVLGCGVNQIVYADSSEADHVTMLPSAYCALTLQEDGSVLLQGGGYGHGLGMSQNGANGMAKAGMNYKDILHYFYNDIKIENMK